MERLTERIGEDFQCNNRECMLSYCDRGCGNYNLMIKKLAEYEDAEEQGLLLRLPCKVGDTVYTVDYYYDCDCDYECIELDSYKCEEDLPCEHQYKVYRVKEIKFQEQMLVVVGKTVFLTKEEAEAALQKFREGE